MMRSMIVTHLYRFREPCRSDASSALSAFSFASIISLALSSPLAAQVVGQNKTDNGPTTYTLTTSTRLVIETVSVKDKAGNSITGLTAKDFTVTEDGVEQKVRICEYQDLPTAPAPPPKVADDVTIYKPPGRHTDRT